MRIEVTRQNDKFHFQGVNADGNSVDIDGAPAIGGENAGVRPMELLLMGLAGCSGIDIGLILGKQKLYPTDLRFVVTGERQKDAVPSLFEKVQLEVYLEGEMPASKVKRAVQLSIDKYCSVAKTLESTAEIQYEVYLNGEVI